MKKEIYSEIRNVIKQRLTEVSDHSFIPPISSHSMFIIIN